MHLSRKLVALLASLAALIAVIGVSGASAGNGGTGVTGTPTITPQVINDASLHASTKTIGGAKVQPTTKTVAHWHGSTVDPDNGVTYGYNMVGADPNNCSGNACSTTVTVDVTPLIVNIDGLTFDGTSVWPAVDASPVFQGNDYGSTPAATAAGSFPNLPAEIEGPGGTLSQGDAGNSLQLEDATMRAQFNQTGSSPYHVNLSPVTHPAVTINVPQGRGTLLKSGRGVIFADINITWWSTEIQNLDQTLKYNDPTHLPLYLTNNILLYIGNNAANCCVIGFHGAGEVAGHGTGNTHGNGNQPVQTFAWASWIQPGIYSRPNGGTDWAVQDIHALSHEISEWADDPFVNNSVEPWLTPTAPQYGCSGTLETGDPVVGIGFAMGSNSFEQGPNPDGTQSADGYYHPEDEVFLPWFMRTAPNDVSEPTQSASTNVGRYTLMGDLNPFSGFRGPATGC